MEQQLPVPNVQQSQITKTPYADGFWQFNQYIVDPKAQEEYPHLIRDIKLSNLDAIEKKICLETLRRIARLKSIGDFNVEIKPKKEYIELKEEDLKLYDKKQIIKNKGKSYIQIETQAVDEYGDQLFELKNKFPRALKIYINDLFSIVNVASATNGFERNALTTQITKGSQHFIEETRDKQKKEWFKFFPRKK